VQVGSHYDSTFSLVHWIKHCKAIIGLSNKNTSSLFWDVFFHPSFFLENVNIRSIVVLETYEQQLLKKEDDWNEYVVHVMENDVGKLMYYQNPLQALATLFSSSQVAFGFHLHPTTPNNSQTYSTLNLTHWWLIRHVRPLSLLFTFFLMMTLCSCFDFFGFILEHNWLNSERVGFFGCSMHLEFVKIYKLWG
jgi:hypothetical protein